MSNELTTVTIDQVVTYLRRAGWRIFERTRRNIHWEPQNRGFLGQTVVLPRRGTHPNPTIMVEQAVRDIARHQNRAAADVLSDIAKELVR